MDALDSDRKGTAALICDIDICGTAAVVSRQLRFGPPDRFCYQFINRVFISVIDGRLR